MQIDEGKTSRFGRGEMTFSHFNDLLDTTKIKSEPVISALYEYLVNGKRKVDSYTPYKVDMSLFSRRLAALQKASDAAEKLAKYYR